MNARNFHEPICFNFLIKSCIFRQYSLRFKPKNNVTLLKVKFQIKRPAAYQFEFILLTFVYGVGNFFIPRIFLVVNLTCRLRSFLEACMKCNRKCIRS